MTVKVLVVDDSTFFRKRLTELLETDPRLEVVATAANGKQALTLFQQHQPDVITMDVEMPVMDGITAVKKIQAIRQTPILMISSWTTAGAKSTLEALEAGATDFIPKKLDELSPDKKASQRLLCQRIYKVATDFHPTRQPAAPNLNEIPTPAAYKASKLSQFDLISIGTSTGGPVALQKVLTQLPASFSKPILLIQHMPGSFTPSFAERLDKLCAIKVKEAQQGDILQAGVAYLAPGGQQMLVKRTSSGLILNIEESQPEQTYKPCIDLTLNSIAPICGNKTLSIILTGMGSDGTLGSEAIKSSGGEIWAQDEKSSTIYGMPSAVAKKGITDKILDLMEIGKHLADMI